MMMSRCSFNPVPAADEIMLFGVRVKLDPMRKSVSMNNLSEYELPYQELTNSAAAGATGYASADDVVHHQSTPSRERKRGVPWTEDEHKLFLLGLQKVGKGDWRGISRNFVKSRTPTQVASHAQKYFLRKSNLNRRRRRSSLFDITTDSVTAFSTEEEHVHQDNVMQLSEAPNIGGFPVTPYPGSVVPVLYPLHSENPSGNRTAGFTGEVNNASSTLLGSVSVLPLFKSPAPRLAVEFDKTLTKDDPTVSLNLSLSFGHHDHLSSRHSVYQVPQDFCNRDGMIGVV